jgi:hypothetical protein
MVVGHIWGLFANPRAEWRAIHERDYSVAQCYAGHTLLLALIPAVSGFIGTTQIGWQIGAGDPVKLTTESALVIAVLYYFAMLAAVASVGWAIHWMSRTYGSEQTLSQCVVLASFTATPLFLIGIMELYPIMWLNLVLGLPVLAYTIYLFYNGVPTMMEISQERAFLFASAVLAFGLVALVALLGVTVFLWGMGIGPAFTR